MLTALSTVIILAGLVGAAFGVVGYQTGLEENAEDLSMGSLIGGVAILFVAYLIGGWAAGRIARYDGARNGFATGVWTLVFAAILAGLGAWAGAEYDVFENVDLPQWFDSDALTTAAIASGIGAIVAMFVGGIIGGFWGERYHRRADATIADTRRSTVRTDHRTDDRVAHDDRVAMTTATCPLRRRTTARATRTTTATCPHRRRTTARATESAVGAASAAPTDSVPRES